MTKFASVLHRAGLRRAAKILLFGAVALAMAGAAHAQAIPVQTQSPLYTPFSIPRVKGQLQYSITGSGGVSLGYDGDNGTNSFGGISGNLAFNAPSVRYPFSIVYSGGYSFNSIGGTSPFFQNLSLSQGYSTARWRFNLADNISYLPYTATAGLSGIPGVGDLGVSGTDSPQQLLTVNAARVNNSASGTVGHNLTGKTSLNGSVNYSIQRYLADVNAIQSDSLTGGGGLSHRIDARTSLSGNYSYSRFTYANQPQAFTSQGAQVTYTRQLTRHLNLSLGAGPQFIGATGSGNTGDGNTTITYSADTHLTYTGSSASAATLSAGYVRGVNSGFGAGFGSENDSFSLSGTRRITRLLQPSAQISYTRSVGLDLVAGPPFEIDTVAASTQLNRALTRVLSVYGSYTATHQTNSGSFPGISPLTGLNQTLSFGLTYSPSSIHVGRQ
jgi:hypothetical protein